MSKATEPAVSDSLAPLGIDARSARTSGFVPNGTGRGAPSGVEDAVRQANIELQRRSADQLALPLAIAMEQRDEAYKQLQLERHAWQTQHKALVSSHESELQERENTLDSLRQQLRDAERELSGLREDPKTVIGVGPVSTQMRALQPHDSGEHRLQTTLESAWQDVADLRVRLAQTELERDDATREADDLRIEVYSKLATVRDEVIELEGRLVESQRTLGDKCEAWEAERSRLLNQVEEVRHALRSQVEVNIALRRAIASGIPAAYAPSETHLEGLPVDSPADMVSMPPVQTSAPLFEPVPESGYGLDGQHSPDGWVIPLHSDRRPAIVPEASAAPTMASLMGFDTAPPDAAEAASEAASALDQELLEINRRSRGFGLSRLFQRTK
jgi:hypothetical protein